METSKEIHAKLINVLIKEDKKRKDKNIYRLGIMLEALEHAESHKAGIIEGINEAFCGHLRDRMLKALGCNPKSIEESQNWHRM